MVRPKARRGDDDLGPVTDKTSWVEGHAVTASSLGVKGCQVLQTYRILLHLLDLVCIMTLIPLNEVSGPGLQLGAQFFEQLVGSVSVDSSYSITDYGATGCGNPSYDARLGKNFGVGILVHPGLRRLHFEVEVPLRVPDRVANFLNLFKGLDIPVFSYVCISGESGSEGVQTVHPEFAILGGFNSFQLILFVLKSTTGQQITGCTYIPVLPLSRCTDDYMPWFLPCTHPRIQNPDRLPRGVQLPMAAPIIPHVNKVPDTYHASVAVLNKEKYVNVRKTVHPNKI
ncbi:hypothetical protein M9H77_21912 [Catharanthus roseus]|uniref:Uncharacterized protein n=1 Tax=Catharanthus roseus TaxID=4058 RepID=A0ACC0AP23_CATRO|nr:hypothetical protein M9H77_21912 [Catharanthus roseus]